MIHNDLIRFCFRNKYEQFVAKWAEQSAWSTVALKESAVHKERSQELILLRKAHLTVRISIDRSPKSNCVYFR